MAYSRPSPTDTWPQRLSARVFQCCGWLDVTAGRLLRRLCAGVARAVRPLPWPSRLGLLAAVLGGVACRLAVHGQEWLAYLGGFTPQHRALLAEGGYQLSFDHLNVLLYAAGLALAAASLVGYWRSRVSLRLYQVAATAWFVAWCWALALLLSAPSYLYGNFKDLFDKGDRNYVWIWGTTAWVPFFLLALGLLLCLGLGVVRAYYAGRPAPRPLLGDRVVADLDTHGGDRPYRSSLYWAGFLHFAVFILPFFVLHGCNEDPYGIPKGGGEQVVVKVEVKRIKKEKKEELILNLNSPILFYRPKIEDSKVLEEVKDETEATYQATALKSLGKGGGKGGGWPMGMENAKVRFIRLEYGGGDWDQQMGKNADHNLLLEFQKHTGFKIADSTEHLPIRQLRRFPAKQAPPFVFITGSGGITVSNADVKTLRWYCLEEGGMIFADNGGGSFNSSFRNLMARTFPELSWVDIANDDVLYQMPFLFPNGAPPLWHHSGMRALGLKYNGRWIVFYHQGDLNDAWQTGHSGAAPHLADQAYKMGINVINYSFNQYYERHFGQ